MKYVDKYEFKTYVVSVMLMDSTIHYRSFSDLDDAKDYVGDALRNSEVFDVCIYKKTSL